MLESVVPTLSSGPEAEIRAEMERILRSHTFIHSHRIRRFLQFVVEEALRGRQHRLKEYVIGMEVFGRQESFDPRVDSIVRVEARRLRGKLEEYYANNADSSDTATLRICIRKGSYVPLFESCRNGQRTDSSAASQQARQSANCESYAAYLQGLRSWRDLTADCFTSSAAHFSRAVELDPEYAAAWAALAEALTAGSVLEGNQSSEASARARHAAQKALELNDAAAEAHVAMGLVHSFFEWNWAEGAGEFEIALSLDPANAGARAWYGLQLTCRGHRDRAHAQLGEAERLDPASLPVHLAHGWTAVIEREYEEASRRFQLIARIEPDSPWAWIGLGLCSAAQKMWQEAAAHFMNASQIMRDRPFLIGCLGYCYAKSGRAEEALSLLTRLQETGESWVSRAVIHAGLGESARAFACLQQAALGRESSLPLLIAGPEFEELRDERPYAALQAVMGLAAPVASAA
jgi:tetratricopeptide (TPR) repeat protein